MRRHRPLWYYGILCLVMGAIPNVVRNPPVDPADKLSRFIIMMVFTVLGFGLIGWNGYTNWRDRRKS
jgi:hypothetical protein